MDERTGRLLSGGAVRDDKPVNDIPGTGIAACSVTMQRLRRRAGG
jgi:hypothetical protein